MLNEIDTAKQACSQLAIDASDDSQILTIAAVALGLLALAFPEVSGPLAIAGASSATSGSLITIMGNRAQECANNPVPVEPPGDPDDPDVARLSPELAPVPHPGVPAPVSAPVPPHPVTGPAPIVSPAMQSALTSLASASAEAASGLSTTIATIQSFGTARAAKIAGQPGGLHSLAVQGAALTHNSSSNATQLASVKSTVSAFTAAWSSLSSAAATQVAKATPSQLAQAATAAWQNARSAAQSQYNLAAADLSVADAAVAQLAAKLGNGTISPPRRAR